MITLMKQSHLEEMENLYPALVKVVTLSQDLVCGDVKLTDIGLSISKDLEVKSYKDLKKVLSTDVYQVSLMYLYELMQLNSSLIILACNDDDYDTSKMYMKYIEKNTGVTFVKPKVMVKTIKTMVKQISKVKKEKKRVVLKNELIAASCDEYRSFDIESLDKLSKMRDKYIIDIAMGVLASFDCVKSQSEDSHLQVVNNNYDFKKSKELKIRRLLEYLETYFNGSKKHKAIFNAAMSTIGNKKLKEFDIEKVKKIFKKQDNSLRATALVISEIYNTEIEQRVTKVNK